MTPPEDVPLTRAGVAELSAVDAAALPGSSHFLSHNQLTPLSLPGTDWCSLVCSARQPGQPPRSAWRLPRCTSAPCSAPRRFNTYVLEIRCHCSRRALGPAGTPPPRLPPMSEPARPGASGTAVMKRGIVSGALCWRWTAHFTAVDFPLLSPQKSQVLQCLKFLGLSQPTT